MAEPDTRGVRFNPCSARSRPGGNNKARQYLTNQSKDYADDDDGAVIFKGPEEARQVLTPQTGHQQHVGTRWYYLRRLDAQFNPHDRISIWVSMLLAPIKKPYRDVARDHNLNSIGPNSVEEKLYRDIVARSALIHFLTLAVLSDRVWWAAEAIGHVTFTSEKTSLRRGRGQTLPPERHFEAPPRDPLHWPIRSRYIYPEKLSGASTIDKLLKRYFVLWKLPRRTGEEDWKVVSHDDYELP